MITQCSADINLKDNHSKTPLDIALEISDNATAKVLLDNNANAGLSSGMARSLETKNNQIVNLLLNRNADADDQIDEVSTSDKSDFQAAMLQKCGEVNLGVALAATNEKTSSLNILLDNRGYADVAMPIAINCCTRS